MKKVYTEAWYIQRCKRLQERTLRKGAAFRRMPKRKHVAVKHRGDPSITRTNTQKKKWEQRTPQNDNKPIRTHAPKNFSLLNNPEESIAYFHRIKQVFSYNKGIHVGLKDVCSIGGDAIVILLPMILEFQRNKLFFNGDFPNDPIAKKVLVESGFLFQLFKNDPDHTSIEVAGNSRNIFTHANLSVDSQLCDDVIGDASQFIWQNKKRCPGAYRALIELMMNTNEHAYAGVDQKHWWLCVTTDAGRGVVSFCFFDIGIGIFESLKRKPDTSPFKKLINIFLRSAQSSDNAELFRLIANGTVHRTVTGEPFRGKGIHGIYKAMKSAQIDRLIVISNDVYANLSEEVYKVLNNRLDGTFVYYELNHNSGHFDETEADLSA